MPKSSSALLFVGPLSSPIHGQTVATRYVLERLSRLSPSVVDTARSKLRAHFRAALGIPGSRAVYVSVNSNRGIWLTILLAWLAALALKPVVLHHHSYKRIGRYSLSMALLVRLAGNGTLHLVQGPAMQQEMQARYPGARVGTFSNVGAVDIRQSSPRSGPLTFGHLSNLGEEKGVGRVMDVLRTVPDARLIVAGPADDYAAEAIQKAEAEFGERFQWVGPVYGEAKQAFFDAIDIFLFPSLYPLETQGIVNLEALAAGKPVIAYAQCCIADDIGETGGMAVPVGQDFTAAVMRYLETRADRSDARRRFTELLAEHEREILQLVTFFGGECCGSGRLTEVEAR